MTRLPLALSIGDPAGIGPDLAIEAWGRRRDLALPPFLLLAARDIIAERARRLGREVPIVEGTAESASDVFPDALPVAEVADAPPVEPGHPSPSAAPLIIGAIEHAVRLVQAKRARAVVTLPIAKSVLAAAGFPFPGHTEFLAALAAEKNGPPPHPVMMLAAPMLRTVPVTIHVSLAEAIRSLDPDLIHRTGLILARDLRTRFGIARPRLAVAGLNPHAGEDGLMGREDIEIVAPAVRRLQAEGIDAVGPLPADTMFHPEARAGYDAALCMYHDQALIPVKTLAFDEGVNVTLGLPFVRTSPDHGTAFSLAGTGRARVASFVAALRMAEEMTRSASPS